jgi:hypothetical protein
MTQALSDRCRRETARVNRFRRATSPEKRQDDLPKSQGIGGRMARTDLTSPRFQIRIRW